MTDAVDVDQVEQVRALFDRWAEAGRAEGMERGHGPTARRAFDRLGVGEGTRYLDVGCGNGYTVRWAAELGATAVGIDVSDKMIARARALSPASTRFIHAPYPLPMLKAQSFNAIFSMEVFYYLPDLTFGVLGTARLLEPGGLFACVVDYYEENPASHSWPEDVGVKMNLRSRQGWRDAMEEGGLEVVEQTQLRDPDSDEAWKREAGSLFTLARRRLR